MHICSRPLRLAMALMVSAHTVHGATSAARFELDQSQAFAADTGALLYQEAHWLTWQGDTLVQRFVQYRCPSGEAFASKTVDYRVHPLAPDFHLRDARSGYEEGLRTAGSNRMVFVRRNRESPLTEAEVPGSPSEPPLIADAGFDRFLQEHWQVLLSGEGLPIRFLVPSTQKPIAFKVRPLDSGDPALITVRLSLGAWWGFLAPHIDATYRRTDGRLLQYLGLSNLRDLDGENYNVRIRFGDAASSVDRAALAAASSQPLVSVCPGEMRASERGAP
ncbi:hypothetical protein [Ahniella affigens]|nr:hypothetical protein [Ahniella affigens]